MVNITTVHTATARGGPFDMFRRERPNQPRQRQGAGTGFVIDDTGYVVTNAHVVHGADEVQVRMHDDRHFSALVVGRDHKLDLALLKLEQSDNLTPAKLGSSHALRVGEQVIAVGNPFGLGHSVSMGIVSAKARSIGAGPYDDFIQTDASINPGNSGGPLFNLRGEVVGINTAIRAGADGIGFAIPIDALKDIITQLRHQGFVERGKLGLAFQPVSPAIAEALGMTRARGAMVSEVMKGSSAARAGIREGDVIVAINGIEIQRAEDLPRNVARHAPGSTIVVSVLRKGKKRSFKAKLDKLEQEPSPHRQPRRQHVPSGSGELLGMEMDNHPDGGVRVTSLSRPIEGLVRGDVITHLNGAPIANVEQLSAQLKKMRTHDTALLKIRRRGHSRYVRIPLRP